MGPFFLKIGKVIFGKVFSALVEKIYFHYVKASLVYQQKLVDESPTAFESALVDLNAKLALDKAIGKVSRELIAKQVHIASSELQAIPVYPEDAPIIEEPISDAFVDAPLTKEKFPTPYFYSAGKGEAEMRKSAMDDFRKTYIYNEKVNKVMAKAGIPVNDEFTKAMELYKNA